MISRLLAIGSLGIIVGMGLVIFLQQSKIERMQKFQNDLIAESAKREIENQEIIRQREAVNAVIRKDIKDNFTTIDKYFSSGMSNSRTRSTAVPTCPQAPTGTTTGTADTVSFEEYRKLEKDCTYTTEQLVRFQEWVRTGK